jgi:threonine aldolase
MIDRRSDTVTLPTEAMREAMRAAELGDDSRDRDPTVRLLEEMAADAVGKEAALLVASGTMANLVCLLAHTGRGGEVLADAGSHILRSEMGGIAQLAGLFHRVVPAERGTPDAERLSEMLSPKLAANRLATALVCLETTHNSAGGAVVPLAALAGIRAVTQAHGVPVHIDGARLFNAAVALRVPPSEIARHADSVGFCLSKGLSAPVGSVICGSEGFIEKARAYRRMVGGAMRQAGVFAAAGIVALETMVERLGDDHRRASRIAAGLRTLDARLADPREVETNIVMVDVSATGIDANAWVEALAARGVRAGGWAPTQLRLVTHRHITDEDAERTIAVFRSVHAERTPALARAV